MAGNGHFIIGRSGDGSKPGELCPEKELDDGCRSAAIMAPFPRPPDADRRSSESPSNGPPPLLLCADERECQRFAGDMESLCHRLQACIRPDDEMHLRPAAIATSGKSTHCSPVSAAVSRFSPPPRPCASGARPCAGWSRHRPSPATAMRKATASPTPDGPAVLCIRWRLATSAPARRHFDAARPRSSSSGATFDDEIDVATQRRTENCSTPGCPCGAAPAGDAGGREKGRSTCRSLRDCCQ